MIEANSTLESLPCGCKFQNIDDTFVFLPHNLQCEYYRYVLEECERQGKPVMIIDTRTVK